VLYLILAAFFAGAGYAIYNYVVLPRLPKQKKGKTAVAPKYVSSSTPATPVPAEQNEWMCVFDSLSSDYLGNVTKRRALTQSRAPPALQSCQEAGARSNQRQREWHRRCKQPGSIRQERPEGQARLRGQGNKS
jgi:hypothetical protein